MQFGTGEPPTWAAAGPHAGSLGAMGQGAGRRADPGKRRGPASGSFIIRMKGGGEGAGEVGGGGEAGAATISKFQLIGKGGAARGCGPASGDPLA